MPQKNLKTEMKTRILNVFISVFFALAIAAPQAGAAAADRHRLRKPSAKPSLRELPPSRQPKKEVKYDEIITADYDMRFGKILRVEGKTAFVQIISKIAPAEVEPKIFACNIRLEPVAELESLNMGYKDCFAFGIANGEARAGDIVIVRYYKKELIPAEQ